MSLPARELQISRMEYLELEEESDIRHEYVGGRIFAMVGATEAHELIVNNLNYRIRSQLQGSGCRIFTSSMKLLIKASGNFYYPDVMISCEPYAAKSVYKEAPCLIVEVLSPSTEGIDRREKLQAYQTIDSLKEYIIVSQDERQIELYRRVGDHWEPSVHRGKDRILLKSLSPTDLCLSLDEIYEGVLDLSEGSASA